MAERYTHGMDLGRVRSIADRLAAAQRDLAGVSTRADDAARQLREAWQGEDAQTFARRWPVLRQTLDDQASDLETLVRRLRQQAEEQERASGVGGNGDSDGDGIPNRRDRDRDGDGTPDTRDTDDDNDGTPDSRDPDHPTVNVDADVPRDADGDGYDDTTGEEVDTDGDGTPDYFIPNGSTESVDITMRDVNGDGIQDWTFDGNNDGRKESYYDPATGDAHVINAAGHFVDAVKQYWYIGALFALVLVLFVALVIVTRR